MNLKKLIKIILEERGRWEEGDFTINIGEDEGDNVKHFHLDSEEKYDRNNFKLSAIMLNEPYYFLHGKRKYILNSKELKRLLLWLRNKPTEKIVRDINGKLPRNNWENLRNNWNLANPNKEQLAPLDHNVNINLQMPNYSLLKTNYNKKAFLKKS